MTRVLLTGISGFIGSHTVEHILTKTDWHVVGIASYRHRGDPLRIFESTHFDPSRVEMLYHDLRGPMNARLRAAIGSIDYVINMAAESHVDRSIVHPAPFIDNNVSVALNMLEWARQAKPRLFIQISTDEVYGPARPGITHAEWSSHLPSNPYAASKACQEDIAIAYWRTYGVPLIITNTMNNFGERQDAEKFIPSTLAKLMRGERVTIHGENGVPGSRFYLHARNHADALLELLALHEAAGPAMYPDLDRPARYNIVGEREVSNLEMAEMIAGIAGVTLDYEIVNFHSSRPGHDLRYGLDGTKLSLFGWKPPLSLDESLTRTIRWTMAHPSWLQ
jgi:dTDP-glucose 4,6-dehydratase